MARSRRCLGLALSGAFALTGVLSLGAAPASGAPPAQTLLVSPSAVTVGSKTTLTFTYQTSSASEVKGTITLAIPSGWSGTASVSTADCAAAGCAIGKPETGGDTVTMAGSYLPPGQEFQLSYGDATPPGSPGHSYFTMTGNGTPVSAPVVVAPRDGTGTTAVSPSASPSAAAESGTPRNSVLPSGQSSPSQPGNGSGSQPGSGGSHDVSGGAGQSHTGPAHHVTVSPGTVDASHSSALSREIWLLVILLGALLLVAGVLATTGTTRRLRDRLRPGPVVKAVPNLGPAHAPALRMTADDPPLVVRIDPHPGPVLIKPGR